MEHKLLFIVFIVDLFLLHFGDPRLYSIPFTSSWHPVDFLTPWNLSYLDLTNPRHGVEPYDLLAGLDVWILGLATSILFPFSDQWLLKVNSWLCSGRFCSPFSVLQHLLDFLGALRVDSRLSVFLGGLSTFWGLLDVDTRLLGSALVFPSLDFLGVCSPRLDQLLYWFCL